MTAPSRSQQIHNLSVLSKNFDACMDLYAASLNAGTQHEPIVDPKPATRYQGSQRSRWRQELTHEQRLEQKLDRIIALLELQSS